MNMENVGLDMQSKNKIMQSKNKILSLMQPTYFPWLGYFNLINKSDIFVIYDTVQLTKRSWQVRNKIKNNDKELYLTIPIRKTQCRDDLLINQAEIDYNINWISKHLNSIKHSYLKSPYFDEIYPILENRLLSKPKYLTDITISLILDFIKILDINTQIILSKDIDYTGKKDEALISICKSLNSNTYMSVKGSQNYILEGENLFEKNNIDLIWHEYQHPIYNQVGKNFISHLGIIDVLFNIGPDETKKII